MNAKTKSKQAITERTQQQQPSTGPKGMYLWNAAMVGMNVELLVLTKTNSFAAAEKKAKSVLAEKGINPTIYKIQLTGTIDA